MENGLLSIRQFVYFKGKSVKCTQLYMVEVSIYQTFSKINQSKQKVLAIPKICFARQTDSYNSSIFT